MRATTVIATTLAVMFLPTSVFATACPASALKASTAIWQSGSIAKGTVRNGTHPCGKKMTCVGGNENTNAKRSCSWG